jgi:hypothetical protein
LFGSGCSFDGVTRQGDDEFGEFISRCRETEFQFCFSGFFVVAPSVGSGPRSAASIRLFAAARCSRMSDSIFGLCNQDPQAGWQQKDTPADGLQT